MRKGGIVLKKLLVRYMKASYQDRTITATAASFAANATIGLGKLLLGIYLLSPWFITNAVYYLILCAAKGQALKKYKMSARIEDGKKRHDLEFATYKHSGVFICLLGFSYLLVCLRMFFAGDSTPYNEFYLVYGVATVSFAKLGFAIHGTVGTRYLHNPIVSAMKVFSFTDASVSIVVTQCALLSMLQVKNAAGYSAITGMAVSVLFIFRGILMLRKKNLVATKKQSQLIVVNE